MSDKPYQTDAERVAAWERYQKLMDGYKPPEKFLAHIQFNEDCTTSAGVVDDLGNPVTGTWAAFVAEQVVEACAPLIGTFVTSEEQFKASMTKLIVAALENLEGFEGVYYSYHPDHPLYESRRA